MTTKSEALFEKRHLDHLRAEYSKLKRVDPDSDTLKELRTFIKMLATSPLEQLVSERIPWLQLFAAQELELRKGQNQ